MSEQKPKMQDETTNPEFIAKMIDSMRKAGRSKRYIETMLAMINTPSGYEWRSKN